MPPYYQGPEPVTDLCAVPLTDMIRFPRFLIARLWTPEYGDPDEPDEFAWLWAYSPYHRVVGGTCYPATLVQVSLNDSQVPYWEGAKLVAKMRALKTDRTNPLILKTNMGAGHGGASGRYDALRETAFTYAFILWQMGVPVAGQTSSSGR